MWGCVLPGLQSTELHEHAAHELPEAEVAHHLIQGVLGLIQGKHGLGSQQVQKTIGLMAGQGQQDCSHYPWVANSFAVLYNRFSLTCPLLLAFWFASSTFFKGNSGKCTLKMETPSISQPPKPTQQHIRTGWVIKVKYFKGKGLCLSPIVQFWRKGESKHRRQESTSIYTPVAGSHLLTAAMEAINSKIFPSIRGQLLVYADQVAFGTLGSARWKHIQELAAGGANIS